jgi:hypothetical protein
MMQDIVGQQAGKSNKGIWATVHLKGVSSVFDLSKNATAGSHLTEGTVGQPAIRKQ